jgi:hypothetical protein
MIDIQYPALSRVLAGSVLWRCGVRLSLLAAAAWHGSHTARLTGQLVQSATTGGIAAIVAIAGTVALVAQPALPQYVRSGLPLAWPLAAVTLAIIVALQPSAFERAWTHSVLARRVFPPRGRGPHDADGASWAGAGPRDAATSEAEPHVVRSEAEPR